MIGLWTAAAHRERQAELERLCEELRGTIFGDACNVREKAVEYLSGVGQMCKDGSSLNLINVLLLTCIKLEQVLLELDSELAACRDAADR